MCYRTHARPNRPPSTVGTSPARSGLARPTRSPTTHPPRGALPITTITFRTAVDSDLPQIAEVAVAAFPELWQHYLSRPPEPGLASDIFAICLEAEPAGLLVAVADGLVAGYVFAPRWPARVFRLGLLRGHLWRMLLRGLGGQYGITRSESLGAVRAYLGMWHEAQAGTRPGEGRIFSLGVHPRYRRHGMGTELVRRALGYLEGSGAVAARLEVRAENAVAARIYQRLGFRAEGSQTDSMGQWTIMRRSLLLPECENL